MAPFVIATWNINSARLRIDLIKRFLAMAAPDVLCLQETKCPVDQLPMAEFAAAGYAHVLARGEKGYNGVAILSRVPLTALESVNFGGKGDARHVAAMLPFGVELHNVYVPAGGDIPDASQNEKFGHKLDFVDDMTHWFAGRDGLNAIMVGDFNIAPLESDVWNHKALLDVVSHTPIEVEKLSRLQQSRQWLDTTRAHIPEPERVYSWWSYRARDWAASDRGRRLDHIWACGAAAQMAADSWVVRECRGWDRPSDHVPVLTRFLP